MGVLPKADGCPRRRVAAVTVAYSPPVRDLAVLVLPSRCRLGWRRRRCGARSRRTWSAGRGGRSGSRTGIRSAIRLTAWSGRALAYGLGPAGHRVPLPRGAGFQRRGSVVAGLPGGGRGRGPGARQRRRPGDHAAPSGPVLPGPKLAALAGWSAEAAGEVALAAVGLDPGAGPGRCAALAAAGAGREHRERARLPVPRPDGGAHQDRGVAGPRRAGPAGAGGYRFARGGEVCGAGPDRHDRGRRDPRLAPAR